MQGIVRVLIAPVGYYYRRVLSHIQQFNPDVLYLLIPKKSEEEVQQGWIKTTRENTDKIILELGKTFEYKINIQEVDIVDFADIFTKVHKIVQEEQDKAKKESKKIYIRFDITSAPLLSKISLLELASIWKEIEVYYIPAKKGAEPEDFDPKRGEDIGGTPVLIPLSRSTIYSEINKKKIYHDILLSLDKQVNKKVESQSDLIELMGYEKNYAMTVGRTLKVLEAHGLVRLGERFEKKKSIELTLLGRAIIAGLVR